MKRSIGTVRISSCGVDIEADVSDFGFNFEDDKLKIRFTLQFSENNETSDLEKEIEDLLLGYTKVSPLGGLFRFFPMNYDMTSVSAVFHPGYNHPRIEGFNGFVIEPLRVFYVKNFTEIVQL